MAWPGDKKGAGRAVQNETAKRRPSVAPVAVEARTAPAREPRRLPRAARLAAAAPRVAFKPPSAPITVRAKRVAAERRPLSAPLRPRLMQERPPRRAVRAAPISGPAVGRRTHPRHGVDLAACGLATARARSLEVPAAPRA